MQNKFEEQGLQTVFITKIYGYFGTKAHLTTEQELEMSRHYWLDEHKLTSIPIGIAETAPLPDSANPDRPARAPARYDDDYHVVMVPTFVIVDGNGTVRYAGAGFDEKRIAKILEELLTGTH